MAPSASRYTFVDSSGGNGKQVSTPEGRNIVRSRAMQSVWDQRGKNQRDRLKKNLEIVLETTDTYDKKEAEKASRRRQSTISRPSRTSPSTLKSQPDDEKSDQTAASTPTRNEPPVKSSGDQGVQEAKDTDCESSPTISLRSETLDIEMLDPFQKACLRVDQKTNAYLHHYFNALSWKFTMPKNIWLRYAMEDTGLLHSVLFIAAAHHGFSVSKSQALTRDAQLHAAMAISYIKNRIEDTDPTRRCSDAAIGTIARLITWSIIQGDIKTFTKHMRHVNNMVKLRGGIESLGLGGQLKYLICCNTFGGASIWMSSIPEMLRYPYGSLEYSAMDDIRFDIVQPENAASSFISLQKSGWLPFDLVDVCTAMAKLDVLLSDPRNKFQTDEKYQAEFGHCSNKIALRLMYGTHKEAREFQGKIFTTELFVREITRTTVLVYLFAFHRDVPPFCLPMTQNLKRIRQMMEKFQKTMGHMTIFNAWGGGQLGELLLWILIITGTITLNPLDKQEISWQLRVVAEALNVNVWQRVQQICRNFLWQDALCERRCALFWNDVFYFQPMGFVTEMSPEQNNGMENAIGMDSMNSTFDTVEETQLNSVMSSSSGSQTSLEIQDSSSQSPETSAPSLTTDGRSVSDPEFSLFSPQALTVSLYRPILPKQSVHEALAFEKQGKPKPIRRHS